MPLSRRTFLRTTTVAAAAGLAGCRTAPDGPAAGSRERSAGEWVNDVHSRLNPTRVRGVETPRDLDTLRALVRAAGGRGDSVSVCGGRHAGGGQQFRTDRTLIDTSDLARVLAFDESAGTIDIEAGIRWPALLDALHTRPNAQGWSIRQKQGGADQLSLGGAIGSNIHSRHLRSRPFVGDVEQIALVTPAGDVVTCDRERDANLFRHVVGGYGLFGVVYALRLRLERRRKLVRRVAWIEAADAVATLEAKRDGGAWHGDFQFAIDPASDDFCRRGICSWYAPATADSVVRPGDPAANAEAFHGLVGLAHVDKARAMAVYRQQLLASDGKVVDWSDAWQHGDYVPGYHRRIDLAGGGAAGSEILTELHVPRPALPDFLAEAARVLREDGAELIYGVVRLIEQDDETALAWAKRPYACVIFNLHTRLDAASVERNAATFRRLLDAAIRRDGSYYLTYHRFATAAQTEQCYPQLAAVLAEKRRVDPKETLDSDWYQHYRKLLR